MAFHPFEVNVPHLAYAFLGGFVVIVSLLVSLFLLILSVVLFVVLVSESLSSFSSVRISMILAPLFPFLLFSSLQSLPLSLPLFLSLPLVFCTPLVLRLRFFLEVFDLWVSGGKSKISKFSWWREVHSIDIGIAIGIEIRIAIGIAIASASRIRKVFSSIK